MNGDNPNYDAYIAMAANAIVNNYTVKIGCTGSSLEVFEIQNP